MLEANPLTADSEVADKILQGEDIEGPTFKATKILKSCRRKMEEEQDKIKVEEIRSGFRRWDERTITSPSDLHFGLYKSITNQNEQKDENSLPTEDNHCHSQLCHAKRDHPRKMVPCI